MCVNVCAGCVYEYRVCVCVWIVFVCMWRVCVSGGNDPPLMTNQTS